MEDDCEACKEWEEHRYWNHVDAKGKLFFRVMLDDFSQCMRIPKKFIDHFSEEYSETIYLKDPSGIKWNVELRKSVDGTFLQSGWKEFAEAHHLEENDLLIFEYDGYSCFKVKMLDGSGCEKAHSYCLRLQNSLKQGRIEDFEEVMNTPNRKTTLIASSSLSGSQDGSLHEQQFSSPQKNCRNRKGTNKNERIGSSCIKRTTISNELPGHTRNRRANARRRVDSGKDARYYIKQETSNLHDNDKCTPRDMCMSRLAPLTAEREKRAFQLARTVHSGNPYFISVIQPSCIGKRCFLTVPVGFRTNYLPPQTCSIVLKVPGTRKKWIVNFIVSKTISGLSAHWKYFVRDNSLQVGDICLFELINKHRDKIQMRVIISRALKRKAR